MKIKAFFLAFMLFITAAFPIMVNAQNNQPFILEAPKNLSAELKYEDTGVPYFELKLDIPTSVVAINNNLLDDNMYYEGMDCSLMEIQFDFRYGEYDWNEGESLYWTTSIYLEEFIRDGYFKYYPYGIYGQDDSLNIEAEEYQFRAYFFVDWGYVDDWMDKQVMSAYSNIVSIGNPEYYSGASNWAIAELDRAVKYGFITEKVKDNMSANITREEFAEVAVKLYEKYTGKAAINTSTNVFKDTSNPEIYKAYELKIVNGVETDKYAPKSFITREQMAAMLYRTIKAMEPSTDFSTIGAPIFVDEKDIMGYALENVKFMSKHKFINGMGANRFEPKSTSTREQAVAIAVRVYEKYMNINH